MMLIAGKAETPETESEARLLLDAFLAGRNERTLRAYQSDLERFRLFIGTSTKEAAARQLLGKGLGEANRLVLAYRASLVGHGFSAASTNRALSSLRALVKLARMLGIVSWTLEIPNLTSEPYRDTRGPGVAGFKRLLATTETEALTPIAIRDRALLRLLYDLGLRRSEVAALDLADLDQNRGTIAILGKRRSEKSILSLAPATRGVLTAWLQVRGLEPGPLFTNFDHSKKGKEERLSHNSIYRIVRERGASVGIKVAPHGLRHTAITEACKAAQAAGIPLEEVLDYSRHRDIRVLMIYRDRERNVQGQIAALVAATATDEEED